MLKEKPSLPRGTRDFGPIQMAKREFIFETIKSTFGKFGYQPLETPSIENLSVLMGKYGDEGDQLLFKILNSGDFLKNMSAEDVERGYKMTLRKVAEKGLRYDLTVPFARYVAMNQHELSFPFKRYQIQPVWRADRPQKGRYREFYQCDADVVGTKSMICEAEIILMIQEIFQNLGIVDYTIKFNHRRLLEALVHHVAGEGKEVGFYVAIDKMDKIGQTKVKEELISSGFDDDQIDTAFRILNAEGTLEGKVDLIESLLAPSEALEEGIGEIKDMLTFLKDFGAKTEDISLDLALARGLSYYTGIIFEVVLNDKSIGSLSGGGRYDNLTGAYGVPNIPGTGFSLGVDRLYDVMETRQLFPPNTLNASEVLIIALEQKAIKYALPILSKLRNNKIRSEIYPDEVKLKKQFAYADKKHIPFVLVIGSDEIESDILTLKDMNSGQQYNLDIDAVIDKINGSK